MNIFNYVYDFLDSFSGILDYNYIFLFSVGLFIFMSLCIFISTSRSYESRLMKAVDMLNAYFTQYPQINEDTLVPFNNKMKSNKVPKLLRKQWQQYVLYREGKASNYMSFKTCVSEPIKNSSYKRDIMTLNIFSYIIVFLSLVFNLFEAYELELYSILKHCLITPAIVMILNYIVTIFLNVKHNAIVSDLQTSYQYFEVNIDKATKTLPEYIDYEVLFDREEIKQGIPILYAYLQKRADEEQKELEKARLRNVEHEKFNFDESGVESALVLERAMQEAENYIAERKKLMQDIEQINSDIAQEDLNFREITKEYQRQMQVSKETFANFKAQLEEETSSISINYLKKQQQQELDRQRNLERDYDTASDRHKKINDDYYAELKSVEDEIAEARTRLEEAMMNEFATYSAKVYKEAEKVASQKEKAKTEKLQGKIENLEETIASKDDELNGLYGNELNSEGDTTQKASKISAREHGKSKDENAVIKNLKNKINAEKASAGESTVTQEFTMSKPFNPLATLHEEEETQDEDMSTQAFTMSKPYNPMEPLNEEESILNETPTEGDDDEGDIFSNSFFDDDDEDEEFDTSTLEEENADENSGSNDAELSFELDDDEEFDFNFDDEENDEESEEDEEPSENIFTTSVDEGDETEEEISTVEEVESKPKSRRGRPRKGTVAKKSTGRKPGRPRKVKTQEEKPTRRVGRPRKNSVKDEKPTKKVGRPRKVKVENTTKKKGRGRPKKSEVTVTQKSNKRPGRPRKEANTVAVKKGRGRPKKVTVDNIVAPTKKRGRPRKDDIASRAVDLDKVLKEINDAIAVENIKIAKSKKELEKKTKISKRK